MSRKRKAKEDDSSKPISARAADVLDWLEDINDRGVLVRRILLWWHRETILALAFEALEAISGHDKLLEKLRKAVAIQVTALGGPTIDWAKQQAKKGGDD